MFARIRVYPQNNGENDAGCTLVKPLDARIYLPIIGCAAFFGFFERAGIWMGLSRNYGKGLIMYDK
jgi:hypothetical protein